MRPVSISLPLVEAGRKEGLEVRIDEKMTAKEAEALGYTVYGQYKVYRQGSALHYSLDTVRGKRKLRSDQSPTPCAECKYLCRAISSIIPKQGEWPTLPACEAPVKLKGKKRPASLYLTGRTAKACPDFERREASA